MSVITWRKVPDRNPAVSVEIFRCVFMSCRIVEDCPQEGPERIIPRPGSADALFNPSGRQMIFFPRPHLYGGEVWLSIEVLFPFQVVKLHKWMANQGWSRTEAFVPRSLSAAPHGGSLFGTANFLSGLEIVTIQRQLPFEGRDARINSEQESWWRTLSKILQSLVG